jgi:hypothetical protein
LLPTTRQTTRLTRHPRRAEAEKEGSEGLFLEQWLNGKRNTGISETAPPRASTLPGGLIVGGYPEAFRALN